MSQDKEEKKENKREIYIRNKFYQQIKIRKEKEVNEQV